MSIAPTSTTWPTIFVKGPIPKLEAPPVTGSYDFELAFELTNALNKNPSPAVLTNFLVKHPDFYLDSAGRCGWTALAVAISNQAIPLMQAILDRDPTIARKNYIVDVAWTGSVKMTNVFLQYAGNINQCPSATFLMDGVTPLHNSLELGHDRLTKFLLLRGGVVYEKARQRLLAYNDDSVDANWKEQVRNQPMFAAQMIKEIESEYNHSGSELARGLHSSESSSFFSELPQDAGLLIARFVSPETELRHRFLVKLNLVRD